MLINKNSNEDIRVCPVFDRSLSRVLTANEGPRFVGAAVLDIRTPVAGVVVCVQVAPAPPLVGPGAVPPGAVHLVRTLARGG